MRFTRVFLPILTLATISLAAARPNVLLLAVDDLNDWTGCLGGHPQAKTPHIDALAKQGTLFTNAHCQSPVCNPSRASLMSGRYPHSTGLYFLGPHRRQVPLLKDVTTLPERFATDGYKVMGGGKLFHTGTDEFGKYQHPKGGFGGFGPTPKKKISQPHGHPLWDWGAFPDSDEKMPDHKISTWAIDRLSENHDTPFLLAAGFYRPHVPMFVPQRWFDMHPLDKIQLPEVLEEDRDDLSQYARDLTTLKHVAPTHRWILESGEWKHAVQSYLASTTFVDAQAGRVLEALDESPYRDNTIVVLFSDHGFHLGEKARWAKRSLWDDGTRVPLIVAAPGKPAGQSSSKPAELIDIYPTLLDLCGLEPDPAQQGQSLVPLLDDPALETWHHPAITSFGKGNHAVRSERYRYIRYLDGSEELYDHQSDPHEWHNLAAKPGVASILEKHRRHLPRNEQAIAPGKSTGHNAYAAAAANLKAGE